MSNDLGPMAIQECPKCSEKLPPRLSSGRSVSSSKIIFPNDNRLDPPQKQLIVLATILTMVALVLSSANSTLKDGYKVRQQQEQEQLAAKEREAIQAIDACIAIGFKPLDCVNEFRHSVSSKEGNQALDMYIDYRRTIESGQRWRP